jgi:hypothetical protein
MIDSCTFIELPFDRLQERSVELSAKAEGSSMEDWMLKVVQDELNAYRLEELDQQPLQDLK